MNITVGWRIICYDCGSSYDLHACFMDCSHQETNEGECTNEEKLLCGDCIKKIEEKSE